ncbi:hypothetical protein FLP41_15025 [Paracoccus marcusii]|uniref:hypothetical protein n=1 Tax=Paracoccus marcusii TaxID=59779 RepID=UPI002ED1E796|nr:hypothetical protein FLP41_15025 [Paracoccus marcusii]
MMTANRIDRVPAPLRDRFRVIQIERPTLTELVTVGYLRASERLGDEAAAMIVDALVSADRRGLQPTLRTVERMIESAEGVMETPCSTDLLGSDHPLACSKQREISVSVFENTIGWKKLEDWIIERPDKVLGPIKVLLFPVFGKAFM